jgi:acetoin utilization deacetylase AcuC-like enzyme
MIASQEDDGRNIFSGLKNIRIAFDPVYAHALPEGHRFPMLKYELIPAQLLHEGSITRDNLFAPEPCTEEIVTWTHDKNYYDKLIHQSLTPGEQRKIGFPQSPGLTRRELIITQGTIDCCYYAMQNGVALNVAGGTHHAFADKGEGFCLLNDFAVAAKYLLKKELAKKILIIDLDVHQGNGTARIFSNEQRVFTFSMHGAHNYPFHKEKSDLDIPLNDGVDDEAYLSLLSTTLPDLIQQVQPDFAFYLSGVDILQTDKYGKLNITIDGCKQRDRLVFSLLKQHQIPVTVAMGGGYSPHIRSIVEAHCNTFRAALDIYG